MATNTYVALETQTLSSSVASVTFSSISQNYTDLVLVINGTNTSTDQGIVTQVGNGSVDTGTNYSTVYLLGSGSGTGTSGAFTSDTSIVVGRMDGNNSTSIINYMNYSNSTTHKSVMGRGNNGSYAIHHVGSWRNTAAINTIKVFNLSAVNFAIGCTFTLYGIRAEGVSPAPKATGGAIYSDADYYYHVFGASGTFTPLQSLTADVLVVAGGGASSGGNSEPAGGGGAGGLLTFTSQALSATGYTVTVGGGGSAGRGDPGGFKGTNGGNSQFGALTACIGGGAGGWISSSTGLGNSGGSGGGGSGWGDPSARSGGSGTSGQGYAGGTGRSGSTAPYSSAGGGGAGGTGYNGDSPTSGGGDGGIGATSSLINAIGAATGTGQNVSGTYYFAGGGGGGSFGSGARAGLGGYGGGGLGVATSPATGTSGLAFTGGGGGAAAGAVYGGNGGSGIVIVRYAKA